MKIKLDENLPARLVSILSQLGHPTDTVFDEGLTGRADDTVWNAAQRSERFLITQDLDFSDIRRFQPGTHHGLLLVRLRLPGRTALLQRLESLFEQEDVESWSGCFVVVTDNKLRVRRPGN
jgi:predicted nuclease of predicted toxin-antitoxin system